MEIKLTAGFALIVSDWGYHTVSFRKPNKDHIIFTSLDDLEDEWAYSHYQSEYDVYYSHDGHGSRLESAVHVVAYGNLKSDANLELLPRGRIWPCSAGELSGIPDILLRELEDLSVGIGNHADFARKRDALCSFPILYEGYVATGSVSKAQELMWHQIQSLEAALHESQ